MNPHHPRQSGRTTMMFIRAIASGKQRCGIISPTQAMAQYNMRLFIDLIERVTEGRGEIRANKSRMTVEFMGSTFYFLGLDNKYAMQNYEKVRRGFEPNFDEYKDHTVYELESDKIIKSAIKFVLRNQDTHELHSL